MLKHIRRLILSPQKATFYLAGPISDVADNSFIMWREDITTFLRSIGHEEANPLTKYSVKEAERTKIATMLKEGEKDEAIREYMRQRVISHDLEMIGHCDAIIAFIPYFSMGTCAEIAHAYHWRKPVYVVTTMPREQWSGWLIGLSTLIFTNWDELKAFLRKWRL